LGFAPQISPDDFKAAFTTAEGWGTLAQTRKDGALTATLTPKYGTLRLKTLALALPANTQASGVTASVAGKNVPAIAKQDGAAVTITFDNEVRVETNSSLGVSIPYQA
jgi:hypothetical protein